MVFFSCNGCGDSLKKNQVEKHYSTKCRQKKSLSCIDCSKEFWGEDYNQHTKCISEEEKYSGKNYVPKSGANKGEQKQNQWLEQVQAAIESAKSDRNILQLLNKIKDYPNIPRKQAKFKNFLKNSLRVHQEHLINQAWDLIMKHAEQASGANDTSPGGPVNGSHDETQLKAETEKEQKEQMKKERKEERKRKRQTNNGEVSEEAAPEKPKKKKKRKREEEEEDEEEVNGETAAKKPALEISQDKLNGEEENDEEDVNEDDSKSSKVKFDWESIITEVLKKKGEMPLKKLRKKVLAEYVSIRGEPRSEEKILAKFNKKVNKNPKFKVQKERVKLKE
uniref:Cell growth-regulating nucleolar protein-like n=1 Tax=Crassostrea virginica TaxID=6565 RepID=A0A8B8E9L0_CRAVI|nr:cell growth-regulating nucleolar protein-like [Crassostrea virginica]XP_022337344.1 cell growth-regulating nucleolar protein-like [Crassostrea virginica]XP_022337345.1 cell growth-regulating nucleolar protein-like [Crassostrea virginica]